MTGFNTTEINRYGDVCRSPMALAIPHHHHHHHCHCHHRRRRQYHHHYHRHLLSGDADFDRFVEAVSNRATGQPLITLANHSRYTSMFCHAYPPIVAHRSPLSTHPPIAAFHPPQCNRRPCPDGGDAALGVVVAGEHLTGPPCTRHKHHTTKRLVYPPTRIPSANQSTHKPTKPPTHQPRNFRFAACSQEVCFRNDIAAAFMACGQVLPIKRGAGIDHPFFLDLCRHAAAGRWVHLFPEGKVSPSVPKCTCSNALSTSVLI